MVNVAHDGDDRRALDDVARVFVGLGHDLCFEVVFFDEDVLVPHFFGDERGGFLVQHLVDGDHRAEFHHDFDEFARLDAHFLCEFANGDGFRDADFARDRGDGFFKFAALAFAFVAALAATAARAAATVVAVASATAFAAAFVATATARTAFAALDVEAGFGFFFVVFAFGDIKQGFLPLPFELFVFFGGAFFPLFLFAHFFGGIAFGVFGFTDFPLFFLFGQLCR